MSTFVFKGDSFSYSDPLYPTYEWYTGINTSNTPLTAYQAPGTQMSATTIYVSCPIQYALYQHDLEVWVNNTYDRTVKVTSGVYYTILTSTAPSGVRHIYFSKSGMQSSQSVYRVILNDAYTVSYNMHGHGTAPSSSITEKGNTLTSSQLPNRTATGWHFDGWYTNSSYTTPATTSTVVNSNMTLHAKWTEMNSITFNSNGGSSVATQYVLPGGTATRPTDPTRTKYAFDNWYSDSGLTTVYNFSSPVNSNIILYAKWIPYYTVRFDSMGGSTVASQEVLEGGYATRPTNPTKTGGAQFDNWYTSSSYTTVFNFLTAITGPTTIYARWFDFGLANVKKWFIPEGEVKQVVWNNVVLWKRAEPVTITYRKAFFAGTAPATKTVEPGYVLTAADLPTQTDSTAWSTTGWTIDGTNKISAGYVVNSNITLKAIHKGIITSGNLYKHKEGYKYIEEKGSTSTGSISMGNVGNCNSGSTTKTHALTAPSYSHSWNSYGQEGYCFVSEAAWGGQVTYLTPAHAGRFEWTPTLSSVSFTLPTGFTGENNYTAAYPTVVFRRNDTGAHLWHTSQNSTNKISHAIQEPNSGATNIIYVSYGGNNGSSYGTQLARRTGYRSWQASSSGGGSITCNKSTVKETFYFYVT